jgi:hypothetical protein
MPGRLKPVLQTSIVELGKRACETPGKRACETPGKRACETPGTHRVNQKQKKDDPLGRPFLSNGVTEN